jgi:hypothetical protein
MGALMMIKTINVKDKNVGSRFIIYEILMNFWQFDDISADVTLILKLPSIFRYCSKLFNNTPFVFPTFVSIENEAGQFALMVNRNRDGFSA